MARRSNTRNRSRPLLSAANAALATALTLIALGVWGVAPWIGFGSQYGGVGSIAALSASLAAVCLLGVVTRLQWRPLTTLSALFVLLCSLTLIALFPPRWALALLNDPAGPVFFFNTDRPAVALTIDDGLDPITTPVLLDLLAEHNATATFFVLSSTIDTNRELVARILDEGHELANHQVDDLPLVTLSEAETAAQIEQADAALREFVEPRWFRPGGGIATEPALTVARRRGCTCVLGSVFPFDSHLPWAPFLTAYVGERPTPGDIIVLHDGQGRGARTAEVLRRALPRLAERGLRCVTVSELSGG